MTPTLREWFVYQLRFGSLSFGGAARLLIFRDDMVENKKWVSAEDYSRAFTFASVFPGPNLVNVVVYTGFKLFGLRGALLSILGLCLPGSFIAVGIVSALNLENRHVVWIFQGFAIASTFLFSLFIWRLFIGIRSGSPLQFSLRFALAGLVAAMSFFHAPLVLILMIGILAGLLVEFRVN